MNGQNLEIGPDHTDFNINIAIEENLVVLTTEWGPLIEKVANALASLNHINSLNLNVTYETYISSVPDGQPSLPTILDTMVGMITDRFSRLRGVTNATVSGLGAGPRNALIEAITTPRETRNK